MHGASPAARVFGYPFVCYLEQGREFVTKEGSKLFWPSEEQRFVTEFRFLPFIGDLALAGGSGLLLKLFLMLSERHRSRAAPPGKRTAADN